MKIEELNQQLPSITAVVGANWLIENREWAEGYIPPRLPWFAQLEKDLTILKSYVGEQRLATCYRDSLHNPPEIQKTIFEVHGIALLAAAGTRVELHVPRGDGSYRNFDALVEIQGCVLQVESKTRKDEFPFGLPPKMMDTMGLTSHEGVRATLDPHDARDLGVEQGAEIPGVRKILTPESTVIRQILLEGLEQLPEGGCNVILLGQIEGIRYDLEDALYGTKYVCERLDPKSEQVTSAWMRYPTGAFSPGSSGDAFRSLSGVLWLELKGASVLERDYHPFLNPNALVPIPTDVMGAIKGVMGSWSTPIYEQVPSIEELPPETRRLFGLE